MSGDWADLADMMKNGRIEIKSGDGKPAPWCFDVPEVPPNVTAFKSIDSDGDEQMWVRIGPDSWAVVWQTAVADWIETTGHPLRSLLKYASLVECPDPRTTS